jgi:hypothetical protein
MDVKFVGIADDVHVLEGHSISIKAEIFPGFCSLKNANGNVLHPKKPVRRN